MMKAKLSDPKAVFTLLRGMTVAAAAGGCLLAALLGYQGCMAVVFGLSGAPGPAFWLLAAGGFLALGTVSVGCGRGLHAFYRLAGRLKQGTAFTRENERAVGRIAGQCLLCAGGLLAAWLMILIGECLEPGTILGLYWYEMLAVALCFLGAALLAWALCLLVRRAVALQEDSDLTV